MDEKLSLRNVAAAVAEEAVQEHLDVVFPHIKADTREKIERQIAIEAEIRRRCESAPKLEALLADCRTVLQDVLGGKIGGLYQLGRDREDHIDNEDKQAARDCDAEAERIAQVIRALLARLAAPAGREARDG